MRKKNSKRSPPSSLNNSGVAEVQTFTKAVGKFWSKYTVPFILSPWFLLKFLVKSGVNYLIYPIWHLFQYILAQVLEVFDGDDHEEAVAVGLIGICMAFLMYYNFLLINNRDPQRKIMDQYFTF
jgi:hypothetical protein